MSMKKFTLRIKELAFDVLDFPLSHAAVACLGFLIGLAL